MIPQAFIQDLLARIDIVDVVGRAVKLRKAGANFVGLCPFHAEKSPSFTVSPTKQFYHCFGCGAHGSAIGFLMEHSGLGYVDAITELAQSLGLDVPHDREGPGQRADPRAPGLLELLARAEQFYRRRLRDSREAISYLKSRGLDGRTAARFGIGFAPDQWRALEAAVADYDEQGLVDAGLVVDGDPETPGGRRRRYDRFRGRIMFPIRNPAGKTIGFGGRVLAAGEPKYLNSPETPVFSKGRELYGLFEAREAIRRGQSVVVVEGYMDVVMLAQHGIGNAVATLGTATTADHVRTLLRAADRVVFAFDGDKAGRKAAWRALEASLSQTLDSRRIDFLFLPPDHDPDSFVRAHGATGWREALAGTMPLSELLLTELSERCGLETPEGRAMLLVEIKPLLEALAAPALRLQLVHRVAELARLSAGEVEAFLSQADAGRSTREAAGSRRTLDMDVVPAMADGASARRGAFRDAGRLDSVVRRGRPGRAQEPPDLEQRVRLLLALHPALASGIERGEWLSDGLLNWIERLAVLPPGSGPANVIEQLRVDAPRELLGLQRALESDAAAIAELSTEEAAHELGAAIGQLRDRALRRRIDAVVAGGMRSEADRARYLELMAMRQRT